MGEKLAISFQCKIEGISKYKSKNYLDTERIKQHENGEKLIRKVYWVSVFRQNVRKLYALKLRPLIS
jgi:hypothetical protein